MRFLSGVRKTTPQVSKNNLILRQIFRCDICIIPNYMQIDLNIFRKVVSALQQKYVERHTWKVAYNTTIDVHYKEKLLPDVECLRDTTKDTDQLIACTPIKPKNIIYMKCALVFCDECPNYSIPDEVYGGLNDPFIHFSVYSYQVRFEKKS